MNSPLQILLGTGLLGALPLAAQIATFSFTDPTYAEGDAASWSAGDVAGGHVEIDLASGDYSVTWESSGGWQFWGPLHYVLNLGNSRTGEVFPLSFKDTAAGLSATRTYYGNEPGLMTWQSGDPVTTAGTVEAFGVDFISGIVSLNPLLLLFNNAFDEVECSGFLMVEGLAPEPDSDGDGIPDATDPFADSDLRPTVHLLGVDTGIANEIPGLPVTATGATLADVIQALEAEAAAVTRNKGQHVQYLVRAFRVLAEDGWITPRQRAELIRIIAGK